MTDDSNQTGPAMAPDAGGGEVVVLDGDPRVREALAKLLAASGLQVTATDDSEKVLRLAADKYFAVALLDADTPGPEQGLEVLSSLKVASPATQLVLLANRQTFDVATRGFRAGATDVVAKTPENVTTLVDLVVRLCNQGQRAERSERLLRETLDVHELFLKRLMDASRKAQQAQELASGQSGRWELKECLVLVVDENPRTAVGLQEALGSDTSFRCVSACNGGEALDLAGQQKYQVALVNEQLPDLPAPMVVKSLRRMMGDSIVLSFTHPGATPGRLQLIEETQQIMLVPELTRGDQLVGAIQEMREAYLAKSRERHYLQAFRNEHYDFLKRYVELRQKLTALMPEGQKK